MPSYIPITDSETDPDAPLTSELAKKWRDNFIAAFEGDPAAVAAGITLRDAALNTGAATAQGTAWVGLRTAGLAVGAVGSYALCRGPNTSLVPGTTRPGSDLEYANADGGSLTSPTVPGTWRLMGRTTGGAGVTDVQRTSLWLRIA